jgi:hypothetical protein
MIRIHTAWLAGVLLIGPGPDLLAQAAPDSSLDSLLNTKINSAAKYQQTISEAASSVTIITAEGRGTSGSLSYTYQDAVDSRSHVRLANSPVHMVKGGTGLELTRWIGVGADVRYESGRRTLLGTETRLALITDLHLLLPSHSAASPRGPLDRAELSLRLDNLFDTAFATPGGVEHRQAAIPQDGRTASAEPRYRL